MPTVLKERGSATIFVVVAIAVVLAAAMAGAAVNGLVAAHRRAQAAADLAALAGAMADPAGDRCAVAGRVVDQFQGTLVECREEAATVRVSIVVPVSVGFGFTARMRADARAGR